MTLLLFRFPLRGKVFLNIRRRRWLLKKHNEYILVCWLGVTGEDKILRVVFENF